MLKVGKDNLKATEVDVEALLNQLEKHRFIFKNFMSLGLPDEKLTDDVLEDPELILNKLQENVGNISPDNLSQIRSEATAAHTSITNLENKVSEIDKLTTHSSL